MGGKSSSLINFEELKLLKTNQDALLINTLDDTTQSCLIDGTISASKESEIINNLIVQREFQKTILIYGKNYNDSKLHSKYNQLNKLGFQRIYIYPGGLFEWLLLQEVYGNENFPTTSIEVDLLNFKPTSLK